MEEDTGTGDEGQTEIKGHGQILFDALTDWKVMYMALKCVVLRFSGLFPTPLRVKYRLHHHLPLFQRVLPHAHCHTWVQPNRNPSALRATLGVRNSGRVRCHKVDLSFGIPGETTNLCRTTDTQTPQGKDRFT